MKTRPLLSINIPTYNRVSYLEAALEVLLPQLTDEVEINVSDNNSTDATWDYLGSLAGRVNRVRAPVGTNANYNILSCVSIGTGEYTWVHCDDDIAVLNAAENIVRAIKEFHNPPALSFEWHGYDTNMSGFINHRVTARWKRCDRDEFLRTISYKFTFASAIVIKRGCADVEYIKEHSPIDLIPANIMLSTVGKYNDAVVSEDRLLAARGNPGGYDALTIFSKDIFRLFRMNGGFGYDRSAFKKMYSDSLRTVMVHGAANFPVTWKSVWNVTCYSFGYKNYYVYVLPVLVRRLAPAPLLNLIRVLRRVVGRSRREIRNWVGKFANSVI
jgi:glycosyltransferase involved in cell wall biosynthesis